VIGFVGFVLLVVVGIHLYLWKRLVRDTMRPGPWRKLGGIVMIVLALLIPATLIGTRSGYVEFLAWPGYIWLALMFYLLVTLVVLEIPRLVVSLVWRIRRSGKDSDRTRDLVGARSTAAETSGAAVGAGSARDVADGADAAGRNSLRAGAAGTGDTAQRADQPGIERRLLLARGAAIFAGLTAAGLTGYGVKTALGGPQLDRVQIPIPKLPRAMDGTRLAVVSDIHLGPLTGSQHMNRIVSMINSVDADVVCIVGDMVDGTVEELGRFAEPLRDIRSRQGAYFVTGNHEYYSGFQPWVDEVARLGVRPLRNERLEISTRGGVLDLAGVNDPGGAEFGDAPDFERALGDRDTARPVVLMAHQPVAARDAARYGVDLQLSGHTHGGQMVPFNLLVKLQQPVVAGYGEVDGVPVYVTNGAGFWGPPVRVGVPPQVTLVELRTP
jgi:predicted MPP superfamily phosphohydrolase